MPKTISSVAKSYTVNENHNLKPENLDKIIHALEWSATALARPIACHFAIALTSELFDFTPMTETIKSVCRSTGYALAYSLEHTDGIGYHIHLMVVFSAVNKQPRTMASDIQRKLQELDNVATSTTDGIMYKSVKLFKRRCPVTGLETNNYFHNLKTELYDAVYRYSYMSKQDDKTQVNRRKSFGTSKSSPRKKTI
jgi:hypothetical protein